GATKPGALGGLAYGPAYGPGARGGLAGGAVVLVVGPSLIVMSLRSVVDLQTNGEQSARLLRGQGLVEATLDLGGSGPTTVATGPRQGARSASDGFVASGPQGFTTMSWVAT